jgi:hypothetical protein
VTDPLDLEPQRVQVIIRPKYGTLTDRERKAIVNAVQGTQLGQVRIDEAVVFNLGIGGGLGGLPITVDVWLSIGEGAAGGLLTLAIARAVAPIVKILHNRIARLVTVVHKDDGEPVRYIVDPPDELQALDAVPADYEVTIRTESRTRVWRDRRWEHYESTTRTESGGPGK